MDSAGERRIRLSVEYKKAIEYYNQARADITTVGDRSSPEDIAELERIAEKAQEDCDRIRAEILAPQSKQE